MKVNQLLLERKTFDLEKFKSDCEPFLKELKGAEALPYHGTSSSFIDYDIRKFEDRKGPRDTPNSIHKKLNAIFKEKYGHEFRNWLFLTGNSRDARVYGTLCVVFPIGKNYHYAWSPFVDDLTNMRTDHVDRAHQDPRVKHLAYDARVQAGDEDFLDAVHDVNFKVDTGLRDGIDSTHEVVLKCENFYIFNCAEPAFNNELSPFLRSSILKR